MPKAVSKFDAAFFIFAKKQKKRENHKFSSANSASANRQGRYTDRVDDILCKIITAKKRKLKIKYT